MGSDDPSDGPQQWTDGGLRAKLAVGGFVGRERKDEGAVNAGTCNWRVTDDWDTPVWETSCGESFVFSEGGPTENSFNFCHSCGKRLVIVEPQEP